jgi:nucleotide-binding universal stress UspA family protein
LAEALDASLTTGENLAADLIVVGSAASAPPGRIALSGATRGRLDSARGSVIVLPRETPIQL